MIKSFRPSCPSKPSFSSRHWRWTLSKTWILKTCYKGTAWAWLNSWLSFAPLWTTELRKYHQLTPSKALNASRISSNLGWSKTSGRMRILTSFYKRKCSTFSSKKRAKGPPTLGSSLRRVKTTNLLIWMIPLRNCHQGLTPSSTWHLQPLLSTSILRTSLSVARPGPDLRVNKLSWRKSIDIWLFTFTSNRLEWLC